MAFTHLHVHSEYSLLDGSCKIKELVAAAKEAGFTSLAITDHGVMYGVIEFYRACKKAGIKPILGCEVYVAPRSRLDREPGMSDERYHHLILLAENDLGYHNLMKIVSQGFKDGFYYKPRVDKETLRKYHEGLICSSACLAGEVQRYLTKNMYDEARKTALEYRGIFGEGNYFLELQDHGYPEQKTVNAGLLRLHDDTGIPLIATNDVHYIHAEDWEAHDVLLCIQTQKKVNDEDRLRYTGGQFYLKTEAEMRALFPYAEEALENTQKIADRCSVEIRFGERKLPRFKVPDGYTASAYLRKLCSEGFAERYPEGDPDGSLRGRLEFELSVIENMGFVDYFLIVWDFIHYAKQHGIPVGPGRGSAAGSIVSYSLGITAIDPVRYNLLFERFLNPERITMPDIDVDFCYERRGEVIDYVIQKYGKDEVTQIVTFGTLQARGVVRDVGRALDLPYAFCDKLSKSIPRMLNITLKDALAQSPDFRELYETDEQAKRVVDMSLRLEGLPRHASMHAAGVVISEKPMDEYVPLSRTSPDSPLTTQFSMTTIEELGLLKMDFLGLRTLTVIKDAVDNIRESHGIEIDIDHLDMNDAAVYKYIGTGDADGIFQLESAGMRSFMTKLQPESLEDIIAGIALYRPGPMSFIPKYLEGKRNREHVTYESPLLEPILKATYGCIVYQEQVMQIVQELGGYSLGRADLVRRAMSKKKHDVMVAERQNFVYGNPSENVAGCVAKGISPEVADQIFDEMVAFAEYAFNKAHSTGYAVVCYWTAWLKYYYRPEFMAALMTSVIDQGDKVSEYIYACRQMKIGILPPDVNQGRGEFSVQNGKIRYGLNAIRGIGKAVADVIIKEREKNGPYRSAADFMSRLSQKEINKKTIESFVKAGAFDCFGHTRKQEMAHYPMLLLETEKTRKDQMSGQQNLFDFLGSAGIRQPGSVWEPAYPDIGEYEKDQLLAFEKEVLGIYLSGHPLEENENLLRKNVTARSSDFVMDEESGEAHVKDGETVVLGGIITAKTLKTTKSGQTMAFITLEDMTGSVEVLIFPKDYEKYRHELMEEERVLVSGRVSLGADDQNGKLVLSRLLSFRDVPKELWLQFENREAYDRKIREVKDVLRQFDGRDRAVVFLKDSRQYQRLPDEFLTSAEEGAFHALGLILGKENVAIVGTRVRW